MYVCNTFTSTSKTSTVIVCLFIYFLFVFNFKKQDLPYTLLGGGGFQNVPFLLHSQIGQCSSYIHCWQHVCTVQVVHMYSNKRYFHCTCIALLWLDFRCSRPLFPRMCGHIHDVGFISPCKSNTTLSLLAPPSPIGFCFISIVDCRC